jgi:hypothetical protein
MIAVELVRVVVDEPTEQHGRHSVRSEPVALHAGSSQFARIRYLPQLALVVIECRSGEAMIVPVERVWHMTTTIGDREVVDALAQVIQ